jgi:hypothetical protein
MNCLIKNHATYGIPGGWRLRHPALGREIAGRTPDDVVAEVAANLRANDFAADMGELWQWANETWGRVLVASGQADRWTGGALPPADVPAVAPFTRRVLTPRDTGPVLWGTLHLIPLVFTPERWMAHIELITSLIRPGGYEPGCKECFSHWQSQLASSPPALVVDARAASHWSLAAHNNASKYAGHRQWTWREAAAKWGWPGDWE